MLNVTQVHLRQRLIIGSSHQDISTHLPALRTCLENEESLPYFLAEFASAILKINHNTAEMARNVLREQLVGSGLQVPLATEMVIKDYGEAEAPHAP